MHFLGNITFAGFTQPTSMETSTEATYAEHARLQGKPALQRTGDKNDTVALSFNVHQTNTQPEAFIAKLRVAMDAGEVMPLSTEAGDALGEYVIQSMTISRQFCGPDGSIISATVSVSLLEWATVDGVAARKDAARGQGFAVGASGSPTAPSTQAIEFDAMDGVVQVGAQTQAIDSSLKSVTAAPDTEQHVRDTTAVRLDDIAAKSASSRTAVDGLTGEKYTATRDMSDALLDVNLHALALRAVIYTASLADVRGMVADLQDLNTTMQRASQALAQYTGTRG